MATYHLVQIRTQEKPHRHDYHDLVAFIQSGVGMMFLGEKSFRVGPGSVVFIPHGTPHYFVNTGPTPAVAVTVFSPAYDGRDFVPIKEKEK
jgi:mannose-6-phosphate isomerase-like protein (cupin superfamily)